MDSGVCVNYSWDYQGRTWEWYKTYLLRFSNKPRRVLDIGCGLGLFMECCLQHGIECVGVELSDTALEITQQKGLQVIQHDVGQPFSFLEDQSFDAVFSFQVIEHLRAPAQRNMMKEAYRVLKPNGQLQVDSPCRYYREAQRCPTHIGLLSPKELRSLALESGFKRVDMNYNYRQHFDDLPDEIVGELWKKYQPDIFAQTATILAYV